MSTDAEFANQREVIVVEDHKVACDGGGGALGHPIVFYEMGDDDFIICKYCDRMFALKDGEHDPHRQA